MRPPSDVESFAVGRNGGNAGGNAKADVLDLAELLYCRVYLAGLWPLGIKYGFGVVEDYGHLLGGQE